MVLFYMVITTADVYLCCSLEVISRQLGLHENVAGVVRGRGVNCQLWYVWGEFFFFFVCFCDADRMGIIRFKIPPPPIMFVIVFFFVCLEFQIIRFVISTFTPIFLIDISFVLPPPPDAPCPGQWCAWFGLRVFESKLGGVRPRNWSVVGCWHRRHCGGRRTIDVY